MRSFIQHLYFRSQEESVSLFLQDTQLIIFEHVYFFSTSLAVQLLHFTVCQVVDSKLYYKFIDFTSKSQYPICSILILSYLCVRILKIISMQAPLPSVDSVFEKVGQGHFGELDREEELVFYREVLDKVKANIYIDQINDVDDLTQSRMIWMNKACTDLTGYSVDEAYSMGYKFFEAVQPPESIDIAVQSAYFHMLKKGDNFHGLMRQFDKHKNLLWFHGDCLVLNEKKGSPWQLLSAAVNIQDEVHTKKQLLEMQKENMRLRNQLEITSLTKREKEILCLIAKGKSDRQISLESNTSINTVHTHRKNILHKLGKNKTAELAVFASEHCLV